MLARNLLFNTCAGLIESLRKTINSDNFIKQHRQSPTDFTRQRKLPFPTLIFFLMNLIKGSYQDELDHFFKAIFRLDVAKRIVSKAALAKSRMKLKYEAFIAINDNLINYFYKNFKPLKWNGFTLLAIDGTTVQLPRIDSITKHFGAWHPRQGEKCPMARVSQMFDPLNQMTVDAIIEPKSTGERELAAFHFLKLMPNDLILPSTEVIRHIGCLISSCLVVPISAPGFSGNDGKLFVNSTIRANTKKSFHYLRFQAPLNIVKTWDLI